MTKHNFNWLKIIPVYLIPAQIFANLMLDTHFIPNNYDFIGLKNGLKVSIFVIIRQRVNSQHGAGLCFTITVTGFARLKNITNSSNPPPP